MLLDFAQHIRYNSDAAMCLLQVFFFCRSDKGETEQWADIKLFQSCVFIVNGNGAMASQENMQCIHERQRSS